MSHFTVLVIGDDPEGQLEPYSEHIVLEPYVKFTKEQLIENEKWWIQKYKETTYQKYLSNPSEYAKNCSHQEHLNYLEKIFPDILTLTDEELYEQGVRYYEQDMIGKEGEVYSTYNPKSKWDWYVLGGRWKGYFTLPDGSKSDQALKKDIVFPIEPTFAVLHNGEWHERGKMGWWAMVTDEKDSELWKQEFQSIVESCDENTLFSLYDCHI